MIVVTAPTGNIGHHAVDNLLAAGAPLRLIVRDPAKLAPSVRDHVDIVEGSHGDPAVVDRAFDGADALFWLAPPIPTQTVEQTYLDFTRPAAAAIRRHGVKRVVAVSALGRGTAWEDKAGLVTASIRMIDMLRQTGAAVRGMAMPGFMDNILQQAAPIAAQGVFYGPLDPGKKVPATATVDMGAVAAHLLADATWLGHEDLPVLGPEDLSMDDMAATASDVLGRPVRYQQVPFDAFEQQLIGRGFTPSFAAAFIAMMRAKNEGMDNALPRTPETTVPTPFRHWCETELRPAMNAAAAR